jgi:hypothetical protein
MDGFAGIAPDLCAMLRNLHSDTVNSKCMIALMEPFP